MRLTIRHHASAIPCSFSVRRLRDFLALNSAICLLLLSAVAEESSVSTAKLPQLPVTTGWLGNSLLRGGGHDWSDRNQSYLQLYTSDMAVTPEGLIYCTTTWEEGHRAAGIYKDGDALPDCPTFGTSSGWSVAANDKWLVYGLQGKITVNTRGPGRTWDAASGHHQVVDASKDAPPIVGLALDGDTVIAVDQRGQVRWWSLPERKPDSKVRFTVPGAQFVRLDKRGNLWFTVPAKPAGFATIPVTVRGDAETNHPAADALKAVDDKTHWHDNTGPSALTIDLGGEAKPAILRFSGASMNGVLAGARIAGAAGADGPWTDLVTIGAEPGWWPETVITLDERPWKLLRISGEKAMGLRALQVQVRTPVKAGAVLGFDRAGKQMAALPGIEAPVAIGYDATADRLLVFNDDNDQQIHGFTGLDGKPQRDNAWMQQGRFGLKGGVNAAKGVFGSARFDNVRGIGVDAAGNTAVFSVGGTGMNQSRLESYAPDGKRRWEMKGLAFLDAAETDPGDASVAYSSIIRYRREKSGRDGDGWTAVATTLDRFRYPEDPRVQCNIAHVMGVRRIAGKPCLFVTGQYSDPMAVYRFDADGIAAPCAYFTSRPCGSPYPPNAPAGGGWLMWNDANGDGRFQANEWRLGANLGLNPFTVDTAGGVWFVDHRGKGIRHIPAAPALDAHGAPQWPAASERVLPFPAAFDNPDLIRGVEVAPDGKALFVFGFTKDLPNVIGHNFPVGRLVMRLDISGAAPVETHRTQIPYDVEWTKGAAHDQVYASSIVGEYLFVGYEQRMDVLVLKQADLKPVGRLHIGPQSQTPIFDGPSELIATKVGSEYEFFTAQYTGNATTVMRWNPAQTLYLSAPDGVVAKRETGAIQLTWKPVAGATGWRIERRVLDPIGWGPWQEAGKAEAGTATWTDSQPVQTAAYRVRATGDRGAMSDWSKSVYVR